MYLNAKVHAAIFASAVAVTCGIALVHSPYEWFNPTRKSKSRNSDTSDGGEVPDEISTEDCSVSGLGSNSYRERSTTDERSLTMAGGSKSENAVPVGIAVCLMKPSQNIWESRENASSDILFRRLIGRASSLQSHPASEKEVPSKLWPIEICSIVDIPPQPKTSYTDISDSGEVDTTSRIGQAEMNSSEPSRCSSLPEQKYLASTEPTLCNSRASCVESPDKEPPSHNLSQLSPPTSEQETPQSAQYVRHIVEVNSDHPYPPIEAQVKAEYLSGDSQESRTLQVNSVAENARNRTPKSSESELHASEPFSVGSDEEDTRRGTMQKQRVSVKNGSWLQSKCLSSVEPKSTIAAADNGASSSQAPAFSVGPEIPSSIETEDKLTAKDDVGKVQDSNGVPLIPTSPSGDQGGPVQTQSATNVSVGQPASHQEISSPVDRVAEVSSKRPASKQSKPRAERSSRTGNAVRARIRLRKKKRGQK